MRAEAAADALRLYDARGCSAHFAVLVAAVDGAAEDAGLLLGFEPDAFGAAGNALAVMASSPCETCILSVSFPLR